jgi:hypothetical protein
MERLSPQCHKLVIFFSRGGEALLRQYGAEPRHHTLSEDAALFPLPEAVPPL